MVSISWVVVSYCLLGRYNNSLACVWCHLKTHLFGVFKILAGMSKGWSDICSLSTWLVLALSTHDCLQTSHFLHDKLLFPMVYFCNIQSKNCIISSHLTFKLIQQIFYLILEVKDKSEGQSTVKQRDSTGLGYLKTKLKGGVRVYGKWHCKSSFYSLYPPSISASKAELPSQFCFLSRSPLFHL